MKDAYDAKMWGFVSDYARLDVIYNYGGFYLDTDVELIKTLDGLRGNSMYCGFENNHFLSFGIGYGAIRGHRIIKKILDVFRKYHNYSHPNAPIYNQGNNASSYRYTSVNVLESLNFQTNNNVLTYQFEESDWS